MNDLTCIQSIFVFFHFFGNSLDFPYFDMEIAFPFPEHSPGQMKPEPRDSLLREQYFAHSKHLKISPGLFPIVLTWPSGLPEKTHFLSK